MLLVFLFFFCFVLLFFFLGGGGWGKEGLGVGRELLIFEKIFQEDHKRVKQIN